MFLVGAYQEIMGNLHNLFGNTNVVNVEITSNGYQVESIVKGNKVREVLSSVQYNSEQLLEIMGDRIKVALQNQKITEEEAQKLLQNYARSLDKYTYLRKFDEEIIG